MTYPFLNTTDIGAIVIKKFVPAFGVVGVAALSAVVLTGAPAEADSIILRQGTVIATDGLSVRYGPGTQYGVITTLPYGATAGVWCVEYGQGVTGPYGYTTLWDYVIPNSGAAKGFVTDAYLYTGSNTATAPVCNTDGRNI